MNAKPATTIQTDEKSLTIDRIYKATPQRLFEAWTDPALVCLWLGPGPMKCALPLYEAEKGGRFRIEMTGPGPDGIVRTLVYEGTFDEVVPGERIVMTWRTEDDPVTVVTVTFTPVEGGTRLRLKHEGLPGAEWAKMAAGGWASSLEKMASAI